MLNIYSASAGSGKTFTLAREYLRLLLCDRAQKDEKRLAHSRILAVTFTKKATAEMKERILIELFILSVDPTASEHWEYLHEKTGMQADEIQQQARKHLVGILQDYTRFSVSTIDGFFQQVIRTFARQLGLSATYDLSLDGEEMIGEAVDEIFMRIREQQDTDKDLIRWMIDFTKKNIEENQKWNPNATIKQFSTELLKEKVNARMPELQKTFEDKNFMRQYRTQLQQLCESSRQQIDKLLAAARTIMQVREENWSTNLQKALQKSAEDWLRGNIGSTFASVLSNPEKSIAKGKTSKSDMPVMLNIYEQQLRPIFLQLDQLCNGNFAKDYITACEILPYFYTLGILQDVAKQIETTNRNIGRLPISETNKLVHDIIDGQDAPFIYERYGQYFRHYMIDEFQDTSELQWQNFKPLIMESQSWKADNLIVGDVKQSIYRFRNSEWSLLRDLPDQVHPSDIHILKQNWRTAGVIVEENEKLMKLFSQQAATNIEKEFGAEHWGKDIRYIFAEKTMQQKPATDDAGYFHLQYFEGKDAEEQTLEKVHEQLQTLQQEGITLSQVTLLVRYTYQASMLANYLIERGYNVQSAEGLQIGAHPTIKLLITLLQQEGNDIDPIAQAYIQKHFGDMSDATIEKVTQAQHLPLYEQVQAIINELELSAQTEVVPYLTAFQDLIYHFCQTRIADRKVFLEYWQRKGHRKSISAQQASNALRIMTIHSSKGLEFDIVMIPFFNWELTKTRFTDIIWCEPTTAPFNQLPLVPVHPSARLLQSHFRNEYIQEQLAQTIDNLNLTYVAITRPKYRLYIYGQIGVRNKSNVGTEVYALYSQMLDEQLTYRVPKEGAVPPLPDPEEKKKKKEKKKQVVKEDKIEVIPAQYSAESIGKRLILRSRAEDDFDANAPLSAVDLGIKMHLWLSYVNTWQDAPAALQRMLHEGQITQQQVAEMQTQMQQLQVLLARENYNHWFEGDYQLLTEQDILVPSASLERPDRIMIKGKHAVIIDYKFGHIQSPTHYEKMRDYMAQLCHMGYTTEGYLIYNQLQTIIPVK